MHLPDSTKSTANHNEWPTGMTLWFTGLSGAGKTTLCQAVAQRLSALGFPIAVLDGDEVRQTICAGLGYSRPDREENIRRITLAAQGLVESGVITLVAAISPYYKIRLEARNQLGRFVEIYVKASLATCIERDPKHLYRRAMIGEIESFTGISDPYEVPFAPEIVCDTELETVEESATKVIATVFALGLHPPPWGAIHIA